MEEGLIKIPRRNINGDDEKDPASSVTTLLVLSTFVAVSGSFSYGCAVSDYNLALLDYILLKLFSFFFSFKLILGFINSLNI